MHFFCPFNPPDLEIAALQHNIYRGGYIEKSGGMDAV
jgi:hypothetical protein